VSIIGMVDDLRRIDDGILLGQNYHKLPWDKEHTFAFYFVMCVLKKAEAAFQEMGMEYMASVARLALGTVTGQ